MRLVTPHKLWLLRCYGCEPQHISTLCFDTKMADVSNNERKVKFTKNGKIVKRRLRNPEGKCCFISSSQIGILYWLSLLLFIHCSHCYACITLPSFWLLLPYYIFVKLLECFETVCLTYLIEKHSKHWSFCIIIQYLIHCWTYIHKVYYCV